MKKTNKKRNYTKKIDIKIRLKKTNKNRECTKEYRKNQSKKVLKKLKENNKLKRVEVDVITSFIKEEVYIQVYIDNNYDSAEDWVIGFR